MDDMGTAVSSDPADLDAIPDYELTFTPDGIAWTAGENLVDTLRRELLSPADGDDDEVLSAIVGVHSAATDNHPLWMVPGCLVR